MDPIIVILIKFKTLIRRSGSIGQKYNVQSLLLIRETQIFRVTQHSTIPSFSDKWWKSKQIIWFYILINIVGSYLLFSFLLSSFWRRYWKIKLKKLENKTKFYSLLFFTCLTLSWFRFFLSTSFLVFFFSVCTCSIWMLLKYLYIFFYTSFDLRFINWKTAK